MTVLLGTGIESALESAYILYPNPTRNLVNIIGESMVKIEVFNSVGQLVKVETYENAMSTIQMNMNNVETGLYMVRITNVNDQVIVKRLIVNE